MEDKIINFLSTIEKRLWMYGLKLNDFSIDHLCFRSNNQNDFIKYKKYREQQSLLYSQSFFKNRSFFFYLLKTPIKYKNNNIYYVEYSSPLQNEKYETGFQHIELLVWDNFKLNINKNRSISKDWKSEIKREDNLAVKFTTESVFPKTIAKDWWKITILSI